MQTSLNITYADSSLKKSTKSLTYINPEATNAQLETAASLFSAISNNNYVGAERIDRIDVSEPEPTPPTKPTPTLTLDENWQSYTGSGSEKIKFKKITYSGDGELYANVSAVGGRVFYAQVSIQNYDPNGICLFVGEFIGDNQKPTSFSGTIYATEGENYSSTTLEFSGDF